MQIKNWRILITMQQIVLPIKDDKTLKEVQTLLLRNKRVGRRNFTLFQVGKATLLRVSDVLNLKISDVYTATGQVKTTIYLHDQKTGKGNHVYLNPVKRELKIYYQWLIAQRIESVWLFPSTRDFSRHLSDRMFYKVMSNIGKQLDLNYLGTHTMRKTGAYRIYQQSEYNIGLVMHLLNHSSASSTLSYLGLDLTSQQRALDKIDFG